MNNPPLVEKPRCYTVQGGARLSGRVQVEGSKNAVLPLLAATLLTDEPVTLHNVPIVEDVRTMSALLSHLGKGINACDSEYRLSENGALQPHAPDTLVRRMRASFIVLGPLLARLGEARVPLPGGCVLGPRPVDFHLKGLQALGAQVELHEGVVHARASKLHGAPVYLDFPSVGATQHLLMTAALIPEKTTLYNPAHEPEVYELIALLNSMGAQVQAWPDRLEVAGQARLRGSVHRVIADRINAGTYLIAGAISGGQVTVECVPAHLEALLVKLKEAGCTVEEAPNEVRLSAPARVRGVQLETRTYPGFPNDVQPQMMALLTLAQGDSLIRETIFADRFGQVPELARMGAQIRVAGDSAFIHGVERLEGAEVHTTDIRAGAALMLAGLAAHGQTRVIDRGHIGRGYVDLAGKLRQLGASIEVKEAS